MKKPVDTITCSFKCRIVRPLDADWNEVGPRLRELSWIAHRVLNRTIASLAVAREHPGMVPKAWKSKENPGAAKNKGGKVGAYPMAQEAICDANEHRREAVEDIPATIRLGWATLAQKRFGADVRSMLLGKKSLASFRSPAPIVVASGQGAFSVRRDGAVYVLSTPLWSGGKKGCRDLVIAPDGPGGFAHAARLVSSESKIGDLKLINPKGDGITWLAIISYSYPKPPVQTGGTVAVHRGIRAFATAVAVGECRTLLEGDGIRRQKDKLSARRRSVLRHRKDLSPGARGHGENRRRECERRVEDAEARWVLSTCQQVAAKVVAFALKHHAAEVVIEDYAKPYSDDRKTEAWVTRWPWAQLKGSIAWACKKNGLAVREVDASYITQRCPKCGNEEIGNADRRSFRFACLRCDFRHNIDAVAAMNMLPSDDRNQIVKAASAAQEGLSAAAK